MGINSKLKKVFIDLYSSDSGLLVYTLYSRYGLEPSEAIEFIRKYKTERAIAVDENDRIRLTPEGKEKVVSLLGSLDAQRESSIDYSYLHSIKTDADIEPFAPYLPSIEFYERYSKAKEKDDVPTSK